MKKALSLVMAVVLISVLCLSLASCEAKSYTIGISQYMPHPALDNATQGFKDALIEEFGADNVTFIEQNAQGDATTCTTIANDFVTKNVDLILANATPALQAAANGTTTIPVLGTSITDYMSALGLDEFNGIIGGNVSGTSDLAPLNDQAQLILDIFPETKSVAMLYCSGEANSAYQVGEVAKYLADKGVECTNFPFADSNDVAAVAKAAAAAADVIYIPTDNVAASCAEAINGAVASTGTPIMGGDVDGICAGCGVATLAVEYYDIGVITGQMAAKILKGDAKIEEMAVEYSTNILKKYNKANCEAFGIDPATLDAAGFTAIGE